MTYDEWFYLARDLACSFGIGSTEAKRFAAMEKLSEATQKETPGSEDFEVMTVLGLPLMDQFSDPEKCAAFAAICGKVRIIEDFPLGYARSILGDLDAAHIQLSR